MQQDAIDCATQALEKYNIEKDIAAFIKKEFDKKYNPTWHAVVGRNFGSSSIRSGTCSNESTTPWCLAWVFSRVRRISSYLFA